MDVDGNDEIVSDAAAAGVKRACRGRKGRDEHNRSQGIGITIIILERSSGPMVLGTLKDGSAVNL